MSLLERLFRLRENGADVRTEVLGGVTTFMTMAYIIFVNPAVLAQTGMDFGAVMTATCLSAGIATYVGASDLIPEINHSRNRVIPVFVVGMLLFALGRSLVSSSLGH